MDRIFASLKAVQDILPQARSAGLHIQVESALAADLIDRHGEAAHELLANCRRYEPNALLAFAYQVAAQLDSIFPR